MKQILIEERKEITYKILCDIDSICKQHGITYFLAYGTLLGCIRHNGFIPWDDDIDIWVPVSEYKKFIYILSCETKYVVHDFLVEKDYPKCFAKISEPGTIVSYSDEKKLNSDFGRGISVDIFPLHFLEDDDKFTKNVIKCKKLIKGLYNIKRGEIRGTFFKKIVKKIYYMFLLSIGHDEMYWKQKLYNLELRYNDSDYIGCLISPYTKKDVHSKNLFESTEQGMFENKKFPIPIGWNEILTDIYGDYMKLPPEEKKNTT